MKKAVQIVFMILMISAILFSLSGCFAAWDPIFHYEGSHTDLAVTAIYSIPGVRSRAKDQILILDQDDYGRILFSIIFDSSYIVKNSFNDCLLAVLVMQKSDDSHVYFYPEQNYCMTVLSKTEKLDAQLVQMYFDSAAIEQLKVSNAWGEAPKETDTALYCAPMNLEKEADLPSSAKELVSQEIGSNIRSVLLREDCRDNKLYFVLNASSYEWYAVILDENNAVKNGSSGILELSSIDSIPEQLSAFMYDSGWNIS